MTHGGRAACVALAGRAWLGAPRGAAAAAAGDGAAAAGAALAWAPLAYDALEHAAPFASPRCAEGVVAVAGASLRIFVCDAATQGEFTQAVVPLRYTPRRLCALPPAGAAPRVLVVEADQHRYNEAERRALAAARRVARDGDMDTGDDDDDAADDAGPVPPAPGKWASCVRVVDAASGATLELLELGESEAALSCCCVRFAGRGNEAFVAVGTARALTFHPRTFTECAVHVYRLLDARLVLLHRTPVEAPPLALAAFRGRLLVAVGASARLYDLGKRKLLRKAETRVAPALVVRVAVVGDRAFCGDALHGVSLVRYARERNALVVVAEDAAPRGVTALAALDYDTVAVADKCGGVTVLRAPADADAAGDAAAGARRARSSARRPAAARRRSRPSRATTSATWSRRCGARRSAPAAPRSSRTRRCRAPSARSRPRRRATTATSSRTSRCTCARSGWRRRAATTPPTAAPTRPPRTSPTETFARSSSRCPRTRAAASPPTSTARRRTSPRSWRTRGTESSRSFPPPPPLDPAGTNVSGEPKGWTGSVYKLELQVETPTGGPTRRLGPKSYTGARRRGEGELRARRARS